MLLQRLHLMADGGLGDVQLLGRLGEAEMAGAGLEGAQGIQGRKLVLHRLCLSFPNPCDEKASFVGGCRPEPSCHLQADFKTRPWSQPTMRMRRTLSYVLSSSIA